MIVVVHGIATLAATFFSVILSIGSIIMVEENLPSYLDGFACISPRLGALLLLALAVFAMTTITKYDRQVFFVPYTVSTAYVCTGCGAAQATPAQFCAACGSPVGVGQAQYPNPYFIDYSTVENFNYALIPYYARVLWAKIQAFLQSKNISTTQLAKGAGIVAGSLLILIMAINIFGGPAPMYEMPDQSISYTYDWQDAEMTYFVINGKKSDLKLEGMISDFQTSLDGTIAAFLDQDDTLYVIKNKKMTKVEEDVDEYLLSAEGTGIAFTTEEDDLILYTVKNGKSHKIASEVNSGYMLSPDGKSILYTKTDDDEVKLYLSVNGKDGKKIGNGLYPVGLSNQGKLIYYVSYEKNALYVVRGNKDPQKLANLDNIYGDYPMQFNKDHTQALITLDSGSYITANGKEKVKITSRSISQFGNYSDWAEGIEIEDATRTLPIKTFAGQYFTSGGSLYYLNKRFEAVEVEEADGIDSYRMTLTGEVIYYVDGGDLYRGTGRKAKVKFEQIAEDVSSFTITSDGKYCYFRTYDSSLMCIKKTGKAKLIADDISSNFTMSHDDYLFFITEGDLYVSHNRGKKKLVASDVTLVFAELNATYYATNDAEYIAPKKTQFTKLLDIAME